MSETEAALQRITLFLDAWQMHKTRTNIIYGLGVHCEDEPRDLLASDLRLLLDAKERKAL